MDIDYLVTGGGGFIGCSLAAELLRAGAHRIVAIDNLHPQIHPPTVAPPLPPQVELRVMDICDPAAWDRVLKDIRPQAIVHLAAETGTGQSLDLPVRHTQTNVVGTAEMLEAFGRAQLTPSHILLSSSRAVYGEGVWLDPADGTPFSPGLRTREQLERGKFKIIAPSGRTAEPLVHLQTQIQPSPVSIYGATKLAQEHLLTTWCNARGVPLSILRLQNVYGAGQSPRNPYTGIVGLFHRTAAEKLRIQVYEDGQIGRDFIYIDDVARAMTAALQQPPRTSRTLDVGSGSAMTILEAARAIAAIYDAPEPEVTGAFRYGDVRWAVCDPTDLIGDLGAAAQIGFTEGNLRLSNWLAETGGIDRKRSQSCQIGPARV